VRPVLLLGGLAIARSLGAARIPVIVASLNEEAPARWSRYCSGFIALPPGTGRESLAGKLAREGGRLAQLHGGPLPLFYDNDDRLALVQDFRDLLAPHFALLLNERALAEALLDKARFQALAERLRLPVPRRIAWEALAEERGPVLVKPKLKTSWDGSPVHEELFGGAGKARVFDCGRAARLHPLVQALAGGLAFQEYIPGDDDSLWTVHGFAAPGGQVLADFAGRKIRTFPAFTGDSAYLELQPNAQLVALGRDIAARLGLAGIFKMDFKRSAATGRFHLLEVNARFNLWDYLGAKNGVNLPRVAYDFLVHGRRPQPARASTRYRWLAWRYDRRAFKELHSKGQISIAGWLWSLARAPKVYELFAWSDPLPFARFWRRRIERRFRRLWQSTAS
jgi:predicted ATP-grasp superfamily ATP-dependent carboligase